MNRHELVGPGKLWGMKREFQYDFLTKYGLKPHHYLLDIGCGTLRGGIPLIEHLDEGHYYGTEARAGVLVEAELELEESGLTHKKPVLIATDQFEIEDDTKFDFIWAFSVLIHLTDDLVDLCFKNMSEKLAEGGLFYGNVNLHDRHVGNWEGFPVMGHTLEFYSMIGNKYGLAVDTLGTIGEHGHNSGTLSQDNQHMLLIRKP